MSDDTRIHLLEQAYLDLCDRILELERRVARETQMRVEAEQVARRLAGLPIRTDRLEARVFGRQVSQTRPYTPKVPE